MKNFLDVAISVNFFAEAVVEYCCAFSTLKGAG
jgi:hypothetical protein